MYLKCFYKTFILVAILLVGCSKEEDEDFTDRTSPLSVITSIDNEPTRSGVKSMFQKNDEMGLFICKANSLTLYDESLGPNINVKTVYDARNWVSNEPTYLNNDNATVWAYYPYNSLVSDFTQIPVDMALQTDYLYGKSENSSLNNENPFANIALKHACAQLQFTYKTVGVAFPDPLTRIDLVNKVGKNFLYSEGVLNGQTGIISGTKNNNIFIENEKGLLQLEIPGSTEPPYVSMLVIPTQTTGTGDINFYFRIGQKGGYIWQNLPAKTKWEAGKIYRYNIVVNGTGISVGESVIQE